jgi:hypothetical protein
MQISKQKPIVFIIWFVLAVSGIWALCVGNWTPAIVALLTLGLTFSPLVIEDFYDIRIPVGFTAAIVVFICGTLFLGEVGDFYEKYWWWDILLHTGSAVGFGLIGFIALFVLLRGDKLAAPPSLVAMFSFCFALSIGAVWEIFEFAMDQMFSMNMQKSGLVDTMYDLIVDTVGAGAGAAAGYVYLTDRKLGRLAALIDEFVRLNKRLFDRDGNDERSKK